MKLQIRYKSKTCTPFHLWVAEAPSESEVAARNTYPAKPGNRYNAEVVKYADELLVESQVDGAYIFDADSIYYSTEDADMVEYCESLLSSGSRWEREVGQELYEQLRDGWKRDFSDAAKAAWAVLVKKHYPEEAEDEE